MSDNFDTSRKLFAERATADMRRMTASINDAHRMREMTQRLISDSRKFMTQLDQQLDRT